jgi:hypothetical protein
MPFVRCNICSDLFHLSIRGDLAVWEKEHVSERDNNGTPLLKCIRCWVELRAGHKVVSRIENQEIQLITGAAGVVASVEANQENNILVRFGSQLVRCKREDLFYVPGQSPKVK